MVHDHIMELFLYRLSFICVLFCCKRASSTNRYLFNKPGKYAQRINENQNSLSLFYTDLINTSYYKLRCYAAAAVVAVYNIRYHTHSMNYGVWFLYEHRENEQWPTKTLKQSEVIKGSASNVTLLIKIFFCQHNICIYQKLNTNDS